MYKFTDKEIKEIMKGFQIVIDTREKSNQLILDYFVDKDIDYIFEKIDTGDYKCKIKAIPELGIMRDLYIPGVVEKKNSLDEIIGNLQKNTQTAFINELIRGQEEPFVILIEDAIGYTKLINGNYISSYNPKSLLGRLNSLKARYGFEYVFVEKRCAGNWIYHHLYYYAIEFLKKL